MDSHQFEKRMDSLIDYYKKYLDKSEVEIQDQTKHVLTIPKKTNKLNKPEKECLEYQRLLSKKKSKK